MGPHPFRMPRFTPTAMDARTFIRQTPYLAWVLLYCALTWGVFGVMLGLVTPALRSQWLLDYRAVGGLMAVSAAASVLGSLLGGHVATRFSARRLFLAYGLVTLGMLLLVATARSYAVLVVAFALVALCETALFTLGHGVLAQMSTQAELRTRMLGLVDVGFSLGTLVAPLWVAVWLMADAAWQTPYLAFVALVVVLCALLWPRRAYDGLQALPSGDTVPAAGPPVDLMATSALPLTRAAPLGYRGLLRQRMCQWGLLAAALVGFVEWGQNQWLVSLVHNGLHWPQAVARLAVFALMLGMLLGRVWQSFAPSRWTLSTKIRRLAGLCLAALVAQNLAGALSLWWPNAALAFQVAFVLASFGVGLGVSVGFPILLGTLVHTAPTEASRLSALVMIATALGAALAAQGVGRLADAWGITAAFAVLLVAAVGYRASLSRLYRT